MENVFKADQNIPKQIAISKKPSTVEIKNNSGKVLAYLTATTSQVQDPIKQQFLFFLYLCSFIFLGILINIFAKNISLTRPPWMGFAFLVTTVFGIRFVTMQMNFTSKFTEISFFKQNFHSSYLGNSLGDLVINIFLLFWIMVFFHTEFRVRPIKGLSNVQRFGLTTLNYFSIILGILMISNVFQQLVFNTDITFDFDHIFSLDKNSFIAIMASLLLLVALFLFSQRIMETILNLGLKKFVRLGALGLASLLAIPVIIKSNSDLPVVEMVIIGYMFNLIFDIYVDNNRPSFIWLVIWLVVFALIPSILLFKYNNDMDFGRRLKYANELSDLKDRMAEESLEKVKKDIKSDQELKGLLKPHPFQADKKKVLPIINKHFTDNIYLHNNYQYDFHAYTKFGSAIDSFPSACLLYTSDAADE